MKKIRALCALLSLFLLTSCAAVPPGTTAPSATAAEETLPAPVSKETLPETEKAPVELPKIVSNVTMADVDAIPVANADMTEDELRQICIRYMTLQKTVLWTLNSDVTFYCDYAGAADAKGNLHWIAGTLYQGVPYTPAGMDLTALLDLIDENGVYDTASAPNGEAAAARIGSTCSSCCFWAWARVTTNAATPRTPLNGYPAVGSYVSSNAKEFSGVNDTLHICENNGQQTMFESYALLKPADGIVCKPDYNGGHTRMVLEAPKVVRNADGTVNGAKSILPCIEQTSRLETVFTDSGKSQAFISVRKEYTFDELFKSHYVPFTLPEFSGKKKVETATLALKTGDPKTVGELLSDSAVSNYCIPRADLVIRDGEGKVVLSGYVFNSANTSAKTVVLHRLANTRDLRNTLKSGEEYAVTVTARLANGETKTAFEGVLPY